MMRSTKQSRHGAYENPLLLEILAKAHFRQVEGANTFSFPRQEPIQALVLALVAVHLLFLGSFLTASHHGIGD